MPRPLPAPDLRAEIADLLERAAVEQGSTKAAASGVDAAYSTFRHWIADPERFPLAKLPEVLRLASQGDPFPARLAAALGYALVPLDPSPEQIAEVLERHGLIRRGSAAKAATVIRGVQADPRQGRLWGSRP